MPFEAKTPSGLTSTDQVRIPLHTGQQQVWQDASRFRVVVAGRRWGKTQLAKATLLYWALTQSNRRIWYVAPTFAQAKDIMWSDLKRSTHLSWLDGGPREVDLELRFRTGSSIRLFGGDADESLVGRGLGGLVLDEFAIMRERVWSEKLLPALADFQAPALIIGTPQAFNHFYDFFQRGQSRDARWRRWQSWQFKSIENPWLNPTEIEAARAELDPRTFRQEYEASFETVAGRAHYAFNRADHVNKVQLDPAVPVCLSFDFNIHPATAIIGQRVQDDLVIWREVHIEHAGGEATVAAARAVKELLIGEKWTGRIRIYGDPAGKAGKTTGPSDHDVLKRQFPTAQWCVRRAQPHPRDRVAAINGRCETADRKTHFQIDPSCKRTILDLEQVTIKDNGELDKSNPMLTHLSACVGYLAEYEWPQRSSVVVAAIPGLKL